MTYSRPLDHATRDPSISTVLAVRSAASRQDPGALLRSTRPFYPIDAGCTIGIVPHIAAAVMGLAALLHTSAPAFHAFKYLGVAYLLYMAWSTWRERGALSVETKVGTRSALQVTLTAILINILNPKLSIFFLAFLPQFVSPDEIDPLSRMLELSAVFMLMTFAVFVVYGLFAASIRDQVISRPRVLTWMRRTFAGVFAALGASWRWPIVEACCRPTAVIAVP